VTGKSLACDFQTVCTDPWHFIISTETNHPIGVDSTHHFGNAHWKWICSEMADPGGVDSIEVFSCDFQIPEGNFDTNGIQAVRINYGYGEYAIEACTKTPLWVSTHSHEVCLFMHFVLSHSSLIV